MKTKFAVALIKGENESILGIFNTKEEADRFGFGTAETLRYTVIITHNKIALCFLCRAFLILKKYQKRQKYHNGYLQLIDILLY